MSDASLCGTDCNLADWSVCGARVGLNITDASAVYRFLRWTAAGGEFCGVPAGATGVKLGASLDNRRQREHGNHCAAS